MVLRRVVLLLFSTILLVTVTSSSNDGDSPIVKVRQGKVRGKVLTSYGGRKIYTFLGIPYAKPPVDELRFANPKKPENWEGIRDATQDGARCAQLNHPERNFEGDENCLFINVYTTWFPESTENVDNVTGFHDVVVLIHGGGFSHGSGDSDAFAPDHLLDRDIVLVTFNYRLGPLGFLTTGDENAIGNFGLKDQVEALSWIKANILEFGGNPISITLMGSEAGGTSVHYHLLSMLTKDRFQNAISISGTALSPWALLDMKIAKERTEKLGKIVGCSKKEISNTKLLVKCLRKKYTLDIVKGGPKTLEWPTDFSHPFQPVVEPYIPNKRPFLHAHPIKLMQELPAGRMGKWEKPWLIGVASHEGLPQALQAMVFPYIMDSLNVNPEKYVPLFLGMEVEDEDLKRSLGRQIWDFYMKNETLVYLNLGQLGEMVTDYNVFYGVFKSVSLHTKSLEAPIYAYQFSYDRRNPLMSMGVPVGDDMEYLFPNVLANVKRTYQDKERPAIDKLVSIISNFAKYGDPTPEGNTLLGDKLWPQATEESFEFVDIKEEFTIEEGFYQDRIKFWDGIQKQLEKPIKHDEL